MNLIFFATCIKLEGFFLFSFQLHVYKRFMDINITSSPEQFPLYKPFMEQLDNTSIPNDKK